MQILKHNWHWKLISLALSVMVASFVYRQEDTAQSTFFLPLVVQPPPGQRAVEPGPGFQVRVDLQGPAELIRQITSDHIRLRFDPSGVRPGPQVLVPVTPELPDRFQDRVVVRWRPQMVPVRLVSDATKTLDVLIRPLNPLPDWQFTEPPRANPPRVSVSGPQEVIARVSEVHAPVVLKPEERIDERVTLQAVDSRGEPVTDRIRIEPPEASVTAVQQPVVIQKRVPVQPVFDLPPGMHVAVEVNPPRVRLTGPGPALQGIYLIETDPISIPAGQTHVVREVPLAPPREGVQVTPSSVRVTLRFTPAAGRPAGGR